ncbi:MAG TPA: hypothetical protein VJ697_08220 [Nitrososphaeraceae archaeon]|nr:hypothetical protein [Nitrososphaeraceae archaeon]
MRGKTFNHLSCSYGSYAYVTGMTQNLKEKDCKNIATRVFKDYPTVKNIIN